MIYSACGWAFIARPPALSTNPPCLRLTFAFRLPKLALRRPGADPHFCAEFFLSPLRIRFDTLVKLLYTLCFVRGSLPV